MSTQPDSGLIVGAGPVGLAAAVFLARQGVSFRIVDMANTPPRQSRALAVNPRTLELLEPLGVTAEMLKLGIPIRGGRFYNRGKLISETSLSHLRHRYPFMLALSQAVSERLLAEALEKTGRSVERGSRLVSIEETESGVRASLETHGAESSVECSWCLAADGAKSQVRHSLGMPFDGGGFQQPWQLIDVPIETDLDETYAYVFLLEGGRFVFMLRVVENREAERVAAPLWRVLGNFPELVEAIPTLKRVGLPVWRSEFHVAHRIDRVLSRGRICFAGDAAHIHSPIGARGMNLGIEDAWVFSELLKAGQLDRYTSLRKSVDQDVVRRVERISRIALGDSFAMREFRDHILPVLLGFQWMSGTIVRTVTGLDHPLPKVA